MPPASVVLLGAMVALPGASLCIARRLEAITAVRKAEQRHGKTYRIVFEAIMCLLFPILYMSLRASFVPAYSLCHLVHTETDTIVQDRRFLIVKDLGCQVAVYNSIPALIIVWLPPLCISTVAIFYCREPPSTTILYSD